MYDGFQRSKGLIRLDLAGILMTTSKKYDHVQKRGISILVVDDDVLIRDMIKIMVKRVGGMVVGEASDGLEAIKLSNELKPDIVLMDVDMPKMNGLEAARHCYGRVIILTAHCTEKMAEQAGKNGIVTCLSKSITLPDLARAIALAVSD
jgi:response regulator NasT